MKLPSSFFSRENPSKIAKELLGKFLFIKDKNNEQCGGIITETEAYGGAIDKASHAYGNKKTKRTLPMYEEGGRIYIYLCYGMHHLLNIVTNKKNIPEAVLIRAIKPIFGIDQMLQRRGKIKKEGKNLCSGPGKLCKAMGIDMTLNNTRLGRNIWIEDNDYQIKSKHILQTPRIGVDYAGDHALWLWRFALEEKEINIHKYSKSK